MINSRNADQVARIHSAPGRDILVLGAGVVGMATAYALARRGLSVALADADEGPGRGTSFANGAQLSYAYTDALAQPALIAKLPAMLLGLDPAFRVRLSLDPDFLRWGLAFLRHCTASSFERHTMSALALGLESRAAMADLLARHPLDFGHAVSGKLHLIRDSAALPRARQVAAMKAGAGIEQHILDADEARRIEPALADAGDLAGAVWTPADEVGDPYRFCEQLLPVLTGHHGIEAHFGFRAAALQRENGMIAVSDGAGRRITARRIIVCLGADAPSFLAPIGIRVLVRAMKGYSFTAPSTPHAPRVSITDTARKIVFCNLAGQMRVAGLAELNNRDSRVDDRRLRDLIDSARAALPLAADYDRAGHGWAGLRPMTPHSVPIIAEAADGIFLNVGHGMLGWTFAMGAAERTARLVERVRADA
ncbi:MAG: FAD-dependent oxidoreductase [Sphingopyxis sp.]|uniref:FAD-dependent oxidoreductase n=1 Tax=Sphingopyxis sp. TaxID=1908224 RepID=UPI002AB7F3E6|nr:FAD-dependent oxidoreductase [Sphingopyxis sp.]MDZ3831646.1 FAD-dependent oxidoreductase [Sphingopyxis sp.]